MVKEAFIPEIGYIKKLVGEPVVRPDGRVLIIYEESLRERRSVVVNIVDSVTGGWGFSYSHDAIVLLGEGDYEQGLLRLGSACYEYTYEEISFFKPVPLKSELDQLRKSA